MTTYKELKGTQIQVVSSDPDNPIEGQVWYNSTSNALKGQAATAAGSWASGGALNNGREQNTGLCVGTQTAGLLYGGDTPTPGGTVNTEQYDGTSWTEVNNMNTSRRSGGGYGTQSSAMSGASFAGNSGETNKTETWNGTNWTEVANLNTTRAGGAGAGTSDEGILFAGNNGSNDVAVNESYNGSSWTEITDLNTARND